MRHDLLDAPLDSPPTAPDERLDATRGETRSAELAEREYPRVGCGALVLGGAHGALGVVRSLGRRGVPVWFATDDNVLAGFSRHARVAVSWPGPNGDRAVEHLLEIVARHRLDGWVLIPCADEEARLIAQNHAVLGAKFRLVTPPWSITRWAYDKRLTHERAASLGLDFPRSYYPRDRQDLAGLDLRFPVILKPTVKVEGNSFTQAKAWRVDDMAALRARYDEAVALVGPTAVVVQELIPGRGATQFSYAAVWDRGRPVASLVARRSRQYPIDFGYTSTFVETVDQQQVESAACRFLDSLDYDGFAEVEFKYDTRDGRYKLLDVNARGWTWISLGHLAGVDFPYLLWRLAMGESLPVLRGRPGAGWMHASRDFVAACQEMAAGTLAPGAYLKSLRGSLEFAAFAKDDPLPGILDLPLVFSRFLRRRLPDMARRVVRSATPR